MTTPQAAPAPRDPLIDEVRRRRGELLATCDNDLRKLGEAIRRLEREHPDKLVDPRVRKPDRQAESAERP